ncbi:MAG: hypothetical protein ACRELX_02895 [Longimicrobiales bacterium]
MAARDVVGRAVAAMRRLPGILLVAGAALDLIGRAVTVEMLWVAGAHLLTAGVLLAIPAAIVVLAAHFRLPRYSVARRRATWAAVLNGTAVAVFALARWLRGHPEIPPDPPILAAEVIAALVMVAVAVRLRARSP